MTENIEKNERKIFDLASLCVSIIFHPLLMPLSGLFIMLNSDTYISYMSGAEKKILYVIFFAVTFLLPLSAIPFLYSIKSVKSISMETNRERFLPMLFTALSYILTYIVLNRFPFLTPTPVKVFLLVSALVVLLVLFITYFWKISAHLAGIGGISGLSAGFTVLFTADMSIFFISSIIIAGIVGTARLKLGAHTPAQVYTGFVLGFVPVFVIFLLMK